MRTESSGVRLLRLINTRIHEISLKELRNSDRLCLYGTGGYWTAFNRSAYLLSKAFPTLPSFVVTPPGSPSSVVGVSVPEKDLKKYMKTHLVDCQDVDYMEFSAGSIDLKGCDAWHTRVVQDFNDAIK